MSPSVACSWTCLVDAYTLWDLTLSVLLYVLYSMLQLALPANLQSPMQLFISPVFAVDAGQRQCPNPGK